MNRGLISRVGVCVALALSVVPIRAQEGGAKTLANPLIKTPSADPWIVYDRGHYYYTATLDPSGGVWIWKTRTLGELERAEKVKVYEAPPDGERSRQIWAPELHRFGGKWYLYFTASNGVDETHRIYAMESRGADPLGPYELKARVFDPARDGWAIDATVFRHTDDRLYFLYVGHVPGNGNGIYIAPMSDPWTVSGGGSLIAQADHSWEKVRYPINEGPVILRHGGRTFLIYSASDTGTPDYSLGMLTLAGGDVTDARSWRKSPRPVFAQNVAGGVFGPGHNGFFKSPDGKQDWIIYHGKEAGEYTYRNRTTRAQPFTWRADGTPDFGRPTPIGVKIDAPAGEKK